VTVTVTVVVFISFFHFAVLFFGFRLMHLPGKIHWALPLLPRMVPQGKPDSIEAQSFVMSLTGIELGCGG